MFRKIIFDNDGVNIDSEHIAMQDMDEFGYKLVHKYVPSCSSGLSRGDIYTEYKGWSSNAIIEDLINKHSLPEDDIRETFDIPEGDDLYEHLSNLHTNSVIAKFQSGMLKTLPGFASTIEKIRERFGQGNIALCTTSRTDRMHATEAAIDPDTGQKANWGEFFPKDGNLRVSGYGYKNKYEHFRSLNPSWDPDETVIVEDTASSTKKAIDAGFDNVIGIVASKFQTQDTNGNFDPEKQRQEMESLLKAGAKIIVTDYRDIPFAIDWMSNGMNPDQKPDFVSTVEYNSGEGRVVPDAQKFEL